MRFHLLLIFIVCLSASEVSAQRGGQRYGHVNTQEVLLALPERDSMEVTIQHLASIYNDQVGALEKAIRDSMAKVDVNLISDDEYIVFEKKIYLMQKNKDNFRVQAVTQLQQKEAELLTPMVRKVKAAVAKVAEKHNYAYIFEMSEVIGIFPGNGDDITPLVRAELGLK